MRSNFRQRRATRQIPELNDSVGPARDERQQRLSAHGRARDGIPMALPQIPNQRLGKHAVHFGGRHGACVFTGPGHGVEIGIQVTRRATEVADAFAFDRGARRAFQDFDFHFFWCSSRRLCVWWVSG